MSAKAPKRAAVRRARAPGASMDAAGAGASREGPRARRVVRRRTGSASERGKKRSEEEKAMALKELKAKAAAPRVAELSASVAQACARDAYKEAQISYAELKTVADGVLPPDVFEDMLELYSRLMMPSSAEGVFMDLMAAGHSPTEEVCWNLLETFEKAGQKTRAEKVLAYMESRGMS